MMATMTIEIARMGHMPQPPPSNMCEMVFKIPMGRMPPGVAVTTLGPPLLQERDHEMRTRKCPGSRVGQSQVYEESEALRNGVGAFRYGPSALSGLAKTPHLSRE